MKAAGFGEIVCLLGAVHGIFLGIVLWTHPRGGAANRVLAAVVVLYSLQLLEIVLYWSQALWYVPHYWGVSWFFPYLYGPLLLLYASLLVVPTSRLRLRYLGHGIPFLAASLLMSPFYLLSAEAKAAGLEANWAAAGQGAIGAAMLVFWLSQFVHFALYLAATIHRTATLDRRPLGRWLRGLMLAFSVTFTCWFFYGLAVAAGWPYRRAIDVAAVLAMTATIYAIGYFALRHPEVLAAERPRASRPPKYSGSSLSSDDVARFADELVRLMEYQRPFRDPELRLDRLAALIGLSPHELSQIINQGFGENFNDFVNRHRVEEAKRLMADGGRRSETLLSLAFEAGFNNKTSFNQAFKKFTNLTPSRYRESLSDERERGRRQSL